MSLISPEPGALQVGSHYLLLGIPAMDWWVPLLGCCSIGMVCWMLLPAIVPLANVCWAQLLAFASLAVVWLGAPLLGCCHGRQLHH